MPDQNELLALLNASAGGGPSVPPSQPSGWHHVGQIARDLAPLLASLTNGDPHFRNAVMQGYMQSKAQRDREQFQRQQLARQDVLTAAQIANMQTDNARAGQQLQLERDRYGLQDQRDEQNRLEHYRETVANRAGAIADSPGIDALAAQNQLAAESVPLLKTYNVPPAAMASTLPNMGAMVSERKKRRARALYDDAAKRFGVKDAKGNIDPAWEHSISLKNEEFGDPQSGTVKPADLRTIFETPAVNVETLQPATPAAPPAPVVGTQRERGAQLLGQINAAKAAGDVDAAAKYQRQYDDLIRATRELHTAATTPRTARSARPTSTDIAGAREQAYQALLAGSDTTAIVRDFGRLGLNPDTELNKQRARVDRAVRAYEKSMPFDRYTEDRTNPEQFAARLARARTALAASVQGGAPPVAPVPSHATTAPAAAPTAANAEGPRLRAEARRHVEAARRAGGDPRPVTEQDVDTVLARPENVATLRRQLGAPAPVTPGLQPGARYRFVPGRGLVPVQQMQQ